MQARGDLLTTAQVCRELGLTPAKVRRLADEGYLEVSARSERKYGEVLLFHSGQVSRLKNQMPKILSRWASEENVRYGARKAGIHRAVEPANAQEVRKRRDQFLSSLDELPEEAAVLLKASYYLYHLNHYAKTGHQYLYEIKERVLKHFVRAYINSPYLEIVLVQGQQRSDLCPGCRSRANKLNLTYGEYAKSYGGCPRCGKRERYYDLFEFNIRYDNHRFSFHTPFSAARKWFPGEVSLPRQYRGHLQERGLAFGRPITEREARALPMDEVIQALENIF
ncbi:MAG: hypothetical protein K6T66_10850 [Peptococcaceae bacterium]|nr:hypothetical protein [Peptococcaceae bacterium]